MILIPAVDIKDSQCVRLYQGREDKLTVFSQDPLERAIHWQSLGAERLHVVDLNGAFEGILKNEPIIRDIAETLSIPVQVGGGIRVLPRLKMVLDMGVSHVILGTKAFEDQDFLMEAAQTFPDKIIVGIDAQDGFVATHGWKTVTQTKSVEFAKKVEQVGIKKIIVTDISLDGTLRGPNINGLKEILKSVQISVIASGGIGKLEHIRELNSELGEELEGVILGRSLYVGSVDFEEALKCIEKSGS